MWKGKSSKGKKSFDQQVEAPLQIYQPMNIKFPYESILLLMHQTWTIFFDGSFTQQGLSAAILFTTPQKYSLPKAYNILFPCTNNFIEYEA